jgi:hypothetical protein
VTIPMLRRLMGISPLGALDAVIALAGAVVPFLANEAAKTSLRPPGNGLR